MSEKEKWLFLMQHWGDGLKSVSILETDNFWQDVHDLYCNADEKINEGDDYKDSKSGCIVYIKDPTEGNFHFDAYKVNEKTEVKL
jgi:hypothetical protein